MQNLMKSSTGQLQIQAVLQQVEPQKQGGELSVYAGNLTKQGMTSGYSIIKKAFPALSPGFYEILGEMLKEDNFTDERFHDAVKHVLRTCEYPTPTVANFLGYDKRVKLYTYEQICKMCTPENSMFEKVVRIKHNNAPFYVDRADYERYKHIFQAQEIKK